MIIAWAQHANNHLDHGWLAFSRLVHGPQYLSDMSHWDCIQLHRYANEPSTFSRLLTKLQVKQSPFVYSLVDST